MDPRSYHLLPYLDGQHDQAALLDVLARLLATGALEHAEAAATRPDCAGSQATLEQVDSAEAPLDTTLRTLARAALLLA